MRTARAGAQEFRGETRPRKGYICLEAEGSECHFRNIKLKELPSTNPSAAETGAPRLIK